ncbi:hypothetical protein TI39_contig283g00011 [Zymoseptoria brevis]|uniref:Uncharacterized protein n=1 Tax=Zymoseptoria brevis TaxID=1047168 RepID=A0A0F4GWA3_9PEZI|nr:hypothetical protein TI39_contig283g00011 [Zymoseptoria brevis]
MADIQTRIAELQQDLARAERSERRAGERSLDAIRKYAKLNFEFRYLNHSGTGHRNDSGQKCDTEIELDRLKCTMDDAQKHWLATQSKCQGVHAILICVQAELEAWKSGFSHSLDVAQERTKQKIQEIEREEEVIRRQNAELRRQRRAEKNKRRQERRDEEYAEQKRAAAEKAKWCEEEEAREEEQRQQAQSEREQARRQYQEYTNEQERRQDAREEYQSRNRYSDFPPPPPPTSSSTRAPRPAQGSNADAIAKWRAAADDFFKGSQQSFPDPPTLGGCRMIKCQTEKRALVACTHSTRRAFQGTPAVNLKTERLRWHPVSKPDKTCDAPTPGPIFSGIQTEGPRGVLPGAGSPGCRGVESDAKDEVKRALAHLNAIIRKSKFEKDFREYDLVSAKIEADEAHFDWLDAQKTAQEAHALLVCVEFEAKMYTSGHAYQNAKERTRQTKEQNRDAMNIRNAAHNKRILENRAKEAKARDEEQAEERARAERDRKAREKERKYEEKKKQEKQKPRFFPPPPPSSARPDTRAAPREPKAFAEAVALWRVATEKYFNSPDQPFPEPPSQKCRKIGCGARDRVLAACPCNIQAAFEILGVNVRKERYSWHPDKFVKAGNLDSKAKANEIFVVIQSMHEKIEKEKEKEKKKAR